MIPVNKRSYYKKMKLRMLRLAILLILICPVRAAAQAGSAGATPADSSAPAITEEKQTPELLSPSLQLVAVQKSDNSIDLKATLKAKQKGQSYKLYRLKVSFYAVAGASETKLGQAITNGEGKAIINVKADTLKGDADGKLQFKAAFEGNNGMDAAEESVSFKKARLELTPVKEDSLLSVKIKFTDLSAAAEMPVKDVVIGIYVKRLFLPLKVGEGTTDENGEATIEFPTGLPGDSKGNLVLLAKLDENETYGNLEASATENWGVPVSEKITEQPRSLWSNHPPVWMLLTFTILMVAVWGHYIVIAYQLFRLRREEPGVPATKH